MKFIIEETGELKELCAYDWRSGKEQTADLMLNVHPYEWAVYDADADAYRISQQHFGYWERAITNINIEEAEEEKLFRAYKGDPWDLTSIILDYINFSDADYENTDVDVGHLNALKAYEKIRELYFPSGLDVTDE